MRNKNLRCIGKADIKKCFPSINHGLLMNFLNKRIKNDDLLWLIQTLIDTFEQGLSIGSYLSQYYAICICHNCIMKYQKHVSYSQEKRRYYAKS